MSRETLKNFLSEKSINADSISFSYNNKNVTTDSNVDLGVDPKSGEELLDLDNETKGLLGDYLSHIIENSTNSFKILPGNERATASKRGESLTIPDEQGAKNIFVEQGTTNAKNLNSFSNSGKFNNLNEIIDKTGKDSDSHFIYKDADNSENIINESISEVLKNNNRFANIQESKTFKDNKTIKYTDQDSKGKYDKTKHIVNLDDLKNLGASLLLKASGFDNSFSPGDSQDPNILKDKIKNNELTTNNFSNQEDIRKSILLTKPENAFGAPAHGSGESIRSETGAHNELEPSALSSKHFSVNYNSELKFDNISQNAHRLQAAIACKILSNLTSDFMDVIIDLIKSEDLSTINKNSEMLQQENAFRDSGPQIKGIYKSLKSFELDYIKKTILRSTDYPYPNCFEKGIEIFFGNTELSENNIANNGLISSSPGLWMNVASTFIKSFNNIAEIVNEIDVTGLNFKNRIDRLFKFISANPMIKFANVAATVGDIHFKSTGGLKKEDENATKKKPFQVDNIKTTPGTRIAKSRENDSDLSPNSLAWRQGSIPSMYLLPRNVIRAGIKLNTLARGANPASGMLASNLVKETYLDRKHDGSFNRIPEDVAKRLEDKLEGEYVPFYIQDLRTNEIISFHAFLTQLSDTISPNYTSTDGYGRLDSVKTYSGTKRTLQVGFVLYSTSKQDYDEMWYKINKLITLLYPQWTQGTKVSALGLGDSFIQPFSQVLGASPIVRLRIGDVIKSNYSKFNLARLFGIGDPGVNPIPIDFPEFNLFGSKDVSYYMARAGLEKVVNLYQNFILEAFYGYFGTPLQYIPQTSGLNNLGGLVLNTVLKLGRDIASENLINGYANPIGVNSVINKLKKPVDQFDEKFGYKQGNIVKIKPNMVKGYRCLDNEEIYYLDKEIEAVVSSREFINLNRNPKVNYEVIVSDITEVNNLFNKRLIVSHEEILPDHREIFMNLGNDDNIPGMPFSATFEPRSILDDFIEKSAASIGIPAAEALNSLSDLIAPESEKFMLSVNNPFVRAYESTSGRGLAGTVGNISFNWLDADFTWETDYNSRAPKGVIISFGFDVIHDIAPGLDHSGYNRAPLYNVGSIMKEVAGDPHNDHASAEFNYKKDRIVFKTGE